MLELLAAPSSSCSRRGRCSRRPLRRAVMSPTDQISLERVINSIRNGIEMRKRRLRRGRADRGYRISMRFSPKWPMALGGPPRSHENEPPPRLFSHPFITRSRTSPSRSSRKSGCRILHSPTPIRGYRTPAGGELPSEPGLKSTQVEYGGSVALGYGLLGALKALPG